MRGLFISGTDTGVGKSVLSACLLAAMSAAGEHVRAFKPVVTGLDDPVEGVWPPDHELLGSAAGMSPEDVSPLRFGPAVSPHLAAELTGSRIVPGELVAAARARGAEGTLVVEGVGGLLVPLAGSFTVLDLAAELALPLLIAARPGLGTINHTLLSLHAARARGLHVRAVVLTPWPDDPGAIERSNHETIARIGEVDVAVLPRTRPSELADTGARLPWRGWLK
ncbi:MAG: dethiobiotin synthase [Solirubrobacteraceae bacterium]